MEINLIMHTLKILTDLCLVKQKTTIKKYFCRYCLQCFSSENVLADQKVCSKIKCEQAVKSEGRFLEFKNFFKQLPVSFKLILSIF